MWLAAQQVADHNTIARFRSKKLKTIFKDIFKQVVLLLSEEGLITLTEVFTGGTKIESMAGRCSFVWGTSSTTREGKMTEQQEAVWQYAQSIADEEDSDPTPPDFKKIDKEKVGNTVREIEGIIGKNPKATTKAKAKLRYIQKNFPQNLDKYQEQQEILAGRGSYSKTDPDATFMRRKDDHMQNGQLKPGYNVQVSSESQFVVHYTLHQTANDLNTLIPHIDSFEYLYAFLPERLTADAGYGSEENYGFLEQKRIDTYVKYNTFDKEHGIFKSKRKQKNEDFHRDKLYYRQEQDHYICPMGQQMEKIGERKRKTRSGHLQTSSAYSAQNCQGCPLRGACFKAKGNRIVERNHALERHKEKARRNLLSEIGKIKRKQRTADVEPVFAHIKSNRNFKRFTHKGIEKAELEFGLHALAHNLRKKSA